MIIDTTRGEAITKDGETAIDVAAYAAQIAALIGAHIIKIKLSTDHLENKDAKKVYEDQGIDISTQAKRVEHCMQAAFGGRREIMEKLAPNGPVYQAGTLSGNPVAMAAGMASLSLAKEEIYPVLTANADRLERLISEALDREGVAHHVQRASTMLSVRFAEGEGHNFADMRAADTFRYAPFFHALLDAGVYAAPSAFETWFVSTALTDDDFERIERALAPAAKAAAEAKQ